MIFTVLIALQALQVAVLWLHDWVPLGSLNDVAAVRRGDSTSRLVRVTLVQSLPFTVGLVWSLAHPQGPWSTGLMIWLWISYGVLFLGELQSWWIPYFRRPEPERTARYQDMFGATHAFLLERNGVRPNTLHCILHAATALTLLALAAASL